MDIEQLRLILDTARDAGPGAWWIALIWVARPYFAIAAWGGVVIIVARLLFRTLKDRFVSNEFRQRRATGVSGASTRSIQSPDGSPTAKRRGAGDRSSRRLSAAAPIDGAQRRAIRSEGRGEARTGLIGALAK